MKTVVQNESRMLRACKGLNIPLQAARWLEMATDPCHDSLIPPEGFPDGVMVPSAVQIVKQQLSVVTTSGTNVWDCTVFSDITSASALLVQTGFWPGSTYTHAGQGVTPYPRGGVVVRQATTGSALVTSTTTQQATLPASYYTDSDLRVTAVGFEVHNVTETLYRSGACTAWRLARVNDSNSSSVANLVEDDGITACIPASNKDLLFPKIPETVAAAMLIPTTRVWKASEGLYAIPVMTDEDNIPCGLENTYPLAVDSVTTYGGVITTTGAAKRLSYNGSSHSEPWGCVGAIFSGLSPQTKLTVNVIWAVERFPHLANNDINSFARPPSPFCPEAIRLYGEVVKEWPPGVPVRMNGMGDWFSGVAQAVLRCAAPTLMKSITPKNSNAIVPFSHKSGNLVSNLAEKAVGYAAEKTFEFGKKLFEQEKKEEKKEERQLVNAAVATRFASHQTPNPTALHMVRERRPQNYAKPKASGSRTGQTPGNVWAQQRIESRRGKSGR